MRKSLVFAAVIALTTSIVGMVTPTYEEKTIAPNDPPVFEVAVVGKGVPKDGGQDGRVPACKEVNNDERAGLDIWYGAQAGLAGEKLFRLVPKVDDNKVEQARTIAGELQADPRVLAVIGHTWSGTTRAAAQTYAQAGIPLIIPLATAQAAVFPVGVKDDQLEDTSARLTNCFRLPPSDDKVQAPAVTHWVEKLKEEHKAEKVHIVKDTESPGAAQYAVPLCDQIEKTLRADGIGVDSNDSAKAADMEGVATTIRQEHDQGDVVIFCGYMKEADRFLTELEKVYEHDPDKKPTVVFTDALSRSAPVAQAKGFRVYRTGPYDAEKCAHRGELKEELEKAHSPCPEVSAEAIYGRDAVLLIRQALEACKKMNRISRACLQNELQKTPALAGACFPYSFRGGENVISTYYVFIYEPVRQWGKTPSPPSSQEIRPSEIIRVWAKARSGSR